MALLVLVEMEGLNCVPKQDKRMVKRNGGDGGHGNDAGGSDDGNNNGSDDGKVLREEWKAGKVL